MHLRGHTYTERPPRAMHHAPSPPRPRRAPVNAPPRASPATPPQGERAPLNASPRVTCAGHPLRTRPSSAHGSTPPHRPSSRPLARGPREAAPMRHPLEPAPRTPSLLGPLELELPCMHTARIGTMPSHGAAENNRPHTCALCIDLACVQSATSRVHHAPIGTPDESREGGPRLEADAPPSPLPTLYSCGGCGGCGGMGFSLIPRAATVRKQKRNRRSAGDAGDSLLSRMERGVSFGLRLHCSYHVGGEATGEHPPHPPQRARRRPLSSWPLVRLRRPRHPPQATPAAQGAIW